MNAAGLEPHAFPLREGTAGGFGRGFHVGLLSVVQGVRR